MTNVVEIRHRHLRFTFRSRALYLLLCTTRFVTSTLSNKNRLVLNVLEFPVFCFVLCVQYSISACRMLILQEECYVSIPGVLSAPNGPAYRKHSLLFLCVLTFSTKHKKNEYRKRGCSIPMVARGPTSAAPEKNDAHFPIRSWSNSPRELSGKL